jgi:hypothetical protein
MNIFKGQNLPEFAEQFKTDENCKEYLTQIRRQEDYSNLKYSNKTYQIRKYFSKTYNFNFLTHLKFYFHADVLYR